MQSWILINKVCTYIHICCIHQCAPTPGPGPSLSHPTPSSEGRTPTTTYIHECPWTVNYLQVCLLTAIPLSYQVLIQWLHPAVMVNYHPVSHAVPQSCDAIMQVPCVDAVSAAVFIVPITQHHWRSPTLQYGPKRNGALCANQILLVTSADCPMKTMSGLGKRHPSQPRDF